MILFAAFGSAPHLAGQVAISAIDVRCRPAGLAVGLVVASMNVEREVDDEEDQVSGPASAVGGSPGASPAEVPPPLGSAIPGGALPRGRGGTKAANSALVAKIEG